MLCLWSPHQDEHPSALSQVHQGTKGGLTLYVSRNAIDELVKSGGMVSLEGWAYDIIADRLEQTGFKKRSGILCEGTMSLDGSIYCDDSGRKVVVTTHRFTPITIVKSINPETDPSPPSPFPPSSSAAWGSGGTS